MTQWLVKNGCQNERSIDAATLRYILRRSFYICRVIERARSTPYDFWKTAKLISIDRKENSVFCVGFRDFRYGFRK